MSLAAVDERTGGRFCNGGGTMSVGRIATRVVATAAPAESILAVARRMEEQGVGCVVVVDPESRPVGIVTDRDIVTRGVAAERSLAEEPVSAVMTRTVRSINEAMPIERAVGLMGDAGVRRLVVTGDAGKLAGILSVDDVMELLAEEADGIGKLLRKRRPTLAGGD
jgi:CBS domain-containing protein